MNRCPIHTSDPLIITTNNRELLRMILELLQLQLERPLLPNAYRRHLLDSIARLERSIASNSRIHFV